MKIHGLCVAKNEADIIEQTLRAAAEWCDWIYVLDNGSTDDTWEKVQALSSALPCVVPFKQDARPFDDGIRGEILRHYLPRARRGDWWCILDADEIYVDNPRVFLQGVPWRYNAVWQQSFAYRFTDKDLAAYRADPERYADSVPVERKLHYYQISDYSELRFFRHSRNLTYMPGTELRPVYPKRIRLKHFAYRSPDQIRKRLETRREPMLRGEFLHEKRACWVPRGIIKPGPAEADDLAESWEERVIPSTSCLLDRHDGFYPEAPPWTPPEAPHWRTRVRSRAHALLHRLSSALSNLSHTVQPGSSVPAANPLISDRGDP